MTSIPTSLRIAIAFVVALWIVGLTALAFGAPGEIVVVTAAVGTVGALIEWSSHRQHGLGPDRLKASPEKPLTDTTDATESQGQPAPQPIARRDL